MKTHRTIRYSGPTETITDSSGKVVRYAGCSIVKTWNLRQYLRYLGTVAKKPILT